MTCSHPQDDDPLLLKPRQIEEKLAALPEWKDLLQESDLCLIFRKAATWENPLYEIQLAWVLNERLESVAWLWVDALDGSIVQCHWD